MAMVSLTWTALVTATRLDNSSFWRASCRLDVVQYCVVGDDVQFYLYFAYVA